MISAKEAARRTGLVSDQRIRRIVAQMRERYPNVPREPTHKEFSKVSQHPTLFREHVSRLAEIIQDEDRARLLEPQGPKILRGHTPRPRPKTAIIARAAERVYRKRIEREAVAAALASVSTQRRA